MSKKIDKIYTEIISSLISRNKFENYEYAYDIINHLDLKSIYLAQPRLDEIKTIFDNNERNINKYLIIKYEDFFNDKKINFFYILFLY